MTSKEAMEALFNLAPIENVEGATIYVHKIEQDLEVLEILKKHLVIETEDDEHKELGETINCYLKSWLSSDKEDYQKVKEWLEK